MIKISTAKTTASNNVEEIRQFLLKYDNFLLTSHMEPDGDAVGSQLAMFIQLQNLSKNALIIDSDPVPEKYRFLPKCSQIKNHLPNNSTSIDASIFLDAGHPKRVSGIFDYVKNKKIPILNIDHHISNSLYGKLNYVDPSASSTSECLYDIFSTLQFKFTEEIAECIAVGILTDTGRFSFRNTCEKTFRICSELAHFGVNFHYLSQQVYGSRTVESIRLLGAVLSSLRISKNIAFIKLTQQMLSNYGAKEEETEGFVNYALSIKNIKAAVFIREKPQGEFRVSLRSKNADIDVNKIASEFNGGGHNQAAGFRSLKSIEEIELDLIKAFEKS